MGFYLFVLLNGILLLRPGDLAPALAETPIYEAAILCCLVVSLRHVVTQIFPPSLINNPITACVFGVLVSILLSRLTHLEIDLAVQSGISFFKIVLYYMLLVGVVNSPRRYMQFLVWLSIFIIILTVLPLLQHFNLVDIPAIRPYIEIEEFDKQTGKPIALERLKSTGIYDNPNDLARILVVGILLGCFWLGQRCSVLLRWLWTIPVSCFALALHLTHSRGGLLSLLGGIAALLYQRFGIRRTSFVAILLLPALAIGVAGRQTSISTSEGTGQARIKLWNEAFVLLQRSC